MTQELVSPTSTPPGRVPEFTLADRLRKARESAGRSQAELAAMLGVSRRTISACEIGDVVVRRPIIISWAMATRTDLFWLEHGRRAYVGEDTAAFPSIQAEQLALEDVPAPHQQSRAKRERPGRPLPAANSKRRTGSRHRHAATG